MRIGIVAGEPSGDVLAAELIKAISRRVPDARFEGIAGPHMIEAGCTPLYKTDELSVMGLVSVLRHLPRLLKLRRKLGDHFLADPPDVVIGVDAPDFNFTLERRMKEAGIPAIHFVSPSVWAWRSWRVKGIGKSVDLMLTMFPFEARFYERHQVPVRFVGHPLADVMPLEDDRDGARRELGLPETGRVLAVLPGSRMSEIERLGPDFLRAAAFVAEKVPGLKLVSPLATERTRKAFERQAAELAPGLDILYVDRKARQAMTAADAVLVASGTAVLEGMMAHRPMVAAYVFSRLSYFLAFRLGMMKVSHITLPNNLIKPPPVPEFLNHAIDPQIMANTLLPLLTDPEAAARQTARFVEAHEELRLGAAEQAAEAILERIA